MKQTLDPKIQLIADVIEFRGYEISPANNGIQAKLGESDFSDDSVSFYVLKNNPDHVRAKLQINSPLPNQMERDLTNIQKQLQDSLDGVADIDTFHAFGSRRGMDIYYATVTMRDTPSPVIKFQKTAGTAFQQFKGIDSKMFRQSLDNLGLPRSSNLRLALTRIFRESLSAADLYAAIQAEAGCLISDEDVAALESILQLEKVPPFISGLITLMKAMHESPELASQPEERTSVVGDDPANGVDS
ncbi:MAG: hypothetical protein CSA22_00765 [Deltaproteobacteria bacterium]|nr:MAG: hypothetical protein CSA22_00765 [Deltaproteobacteria bacterium]